MKMEHATKYRMITDNEMIIRRLTETANFLDYLKTSPLFSATMISVMVSAIDEAVQLMKKQEEQIAQLNAGVDTLRKKLEEAVFCDNKKHN